MMSIRTNIMVFRAVVLSTLLYACETWTLYRRDIKRLESFQQRKLRQPLNTRWELRLSNNEILKRARLPSVEALHPATPSPLGMSYGWTPPDCLESCSTENLKKE